MIKLTQTIELRNLRPVIERARRIGLSGVPVIRELPGKRAMLSLEFHDGSVVEAEFASFAVCRDWVKARRSWETGYRFVPLMGSARGGREEAQ